MDTLIYPLVFNCSNCGREIIVDRAAVRDTIDPSGPELDSLDTVNAVLHQKGWIRDEIEHRVFCPDCADPG